MELISVKKLSKMLDIPQSTIYEWVQIDFIPHYKVGRLIRFDPEEIKKWLQGKKHSGRHIRRPFAVIEKARAQRTRAKTGSSKDPLKTTGGK